MKPSLLFIFFSSCLFIQPLNAQDANDIVFKYRCVPTSTSDYSIEITKDKFILKQTDKIPDKNNRITKVDSSTYIYSFAFKEKQTVDSIIKVYKLDSPNLFRNRTTEWGTIWEIEIYRNSKTTNIKLPNYNNAGLEALIGFVVCLIPRKEQPFFECKTCKSQ